MCKNLARKNDSLSFSVRVKHGGFLGKGTQRHEEQSIALLAEDDAPNGKRKLNMHPRRCHIANV